MSQAPSAQAGLVSDLKEVAFLLIHEATLVTKRLQCALHLASRQRDAAALAEPLRVCGDVVKSEAAQRAFTFLKNETPDWQQWEAIEQALRPRSTAKTAMSDVRAPRMVSLVVREDGSSSCPGVLTAAQSANADAFVRRHVAPNESLTDMQRYLLSCILQSSHGPWTATEDKTCHWDISNGKLYVATATAGCALLDLPGTAPAAPTHASQHRSRGLTY